MKTLVHWRQLALLPCVLVSILFAADGPAIRVHPRDGSPFGGTLRDLGPLLLRVDLPGGGLRVLDHHSLHRVGFLLPPEDRWIGNVGSAAAWRVKRSGNNNAELRAENSGLVLPPGHALTLERTLEHLAEKPGHLRMVLRGDARNMEVAIDLLGWEGRPIAPGQITLLRQDSRWRLLQEPAGRRFAGQPALDMLLPPLRVERHEIELRVEGRQGRHLLSLNGELLHAWRLEPPVTLKKDPVLRLQNTGKEALTLEELELSSWNGTPPVSAGVRGLRLRNGDVLDTPLFASDGDSLRLAGNPPLRMPLAVLESLVPDPQRAAFSLRGWLLEEARATGSDDAVEALERLLATARAEIRPGNRAERAEALRILGAIDALLTREGWVYRSSTGAGDDVLVSSALRPADLSKTDRAALLAFDAEAFADEAAQRPLEWRLGRPEPGPSQVARLRASPDAPLFFGDCDRLSALYLAIAGELELPLRFVPAVNHAFVRWNFDDGTSLNWETTSGQEMPDAFYRTMPGFSAAAEERGTYLRALDDAETLGYWLALRAQVFQNRGRPGEAEADLECAVALYPRNPVAWNRLALLRQSLGNAPGALEAFAAALEADPGQAQVLSNRASLFDDLGRMDEALADANHALRLNPRNDRALVLRGRLALAAGQPAAALQEFNRALTLHPGNIAALTNRAMVLNQLGEPARAEQDASRAIALDPANAAALGNRAVSRLQLGRPDEALDDLDRALELNPREKLLFANRAALRARARDFQGAEADYSRVLELDPLFAPAHKNRGLARLRLGDRSGALADFRELGRLAPDTPGLDRLLQAASEETTP